MDSSCHCLYSSSIPVTILEFYLEQLESHGILYPNMGKIENIIRTIKCGDNIDFDAIDIDDPLVIVLTAMIEPNCSFQTVMRKVNDRSERFFTSTPKVIRNDNVDIKDIIRKYWKPSPEKIVKSVDEYDMIPLIRKMSGSKTPPRI